MSKRISFKLSGEQEKLALALQRQLHDEGTTLSLDTIVERMFVNWMYTNLAGNNSESTQTSSISAGVDTAAPIADNSNALQESAQG